MKVRLTLGAAVAALITTGAALADNALPALERGVATRHDTSNGLTIRELAAAYAARQRTRVAPEIATAEIPNRLPTVADDLGVSGPDALLTGEQTGASPALGVSFDGPNSDDNQRLGGFRVAPPDTNGDVGMMQVVSYPNVTYEVALKDGTVQATFPGNALFEGFGGPCETDGFQPGGAGDYVVLYDEGRWVYKGWAPNFGIECIAITDGEDALGPVTRYEFQVVPPGVFNDYPKLGVWVDESGGQSAYTLTERNFSAGFEISAYVIDRDAIRAGDPAPAFFRQANLSVGIPDGIMPGHIDNVRVPDGKCPLFAAAQAPGRYVFWEFCEDFENGAAGFRRLNSLSVTSFDNSLGNVPLPGGDAVATLAFFTAFQTVSMTIDGQHRVAFAHTVDVGGDRAGLRWAILDADDYDSIGILETGTYGPNDGLERWMSSPALDTAGNFGIAYTRGGNGTFPGVALTGRETGDPSGQLQQEVTCVDGTGSQTGGSGRWGDYSSLAIDPQDGCTFWAFQEYVAVTGSFDWDTRICSFSFPSCTGEEPSDFSLSVAPGQAGVANQFVTANGTEGGSVVLYLGRSDGTTPISLGTCATALDIANARLIGFGQDGNADGSVTITRTIPAQAGGIALRTQAVDLAACQTSNVDMTTY